jgi:3-hydroxyisobutyrate dehydrogenase-like beta-hydroxyacid dehydrogenase
MAHALLRAGHEVTVWNRTPRRAEDVVAAGAVLAATPAEAVSASDATILSLTDYQAMWDVLGDATDALRGRTLVNLSSDTPDKAREAAAWATRHSARFVAGGVMVPAPMIGTEPAYIYFSADEEQFTAHRDTLAALGDLRYLGEDPGRALLMYQANLDVFMTALAGIAHATAMVGTAGITATQFLPEAMELFRAIPVMIAPDGIDVLGANVDADDHPGAGASNVMMSATADHILGTSVAVGIDQSLPRAVQRLYRLAVDAGFGDDGWTRTIAAAGQAAAAGR